MIFLTFFKILSNGTFCSEIESSKERKEAKAFLKKAVMPKHATTDPSRVADLVKGGGLKPDTLKKRELAWNSLDEFVREQYKITADDAIKSSVPELEKMLMEYFESLRVQQKGEDGEMIDTVPKQRSMDAYKSNLKLYILQKTDQKLDMLLQQKIVS